MNNLSLFVVLVCSLYFCQNEVGATICKPLSPFKIDCDDCRCSENGKEYTCFAGSCGKLPFEEDDSYVPRKAYPSHLDNGYPYFRDRLSLNEEENLNKLGDDVEASNEDQMFDFDPNEQINEASLLDEQDASEIDSDLPDDFRYKRSSKPLGLKAH